VYPIRSLYVNSGGPTLTLSGWRGQAPTKATCLLYALSLFSPPLSVGHFCFLFCLLCRVGFCAQLPLGLCAEQCFSVLVGAVDRFLVVQVVTRRTVKTFYLDMSVDRFLSLCGCGGFCGTTRLASSVFAFWVCNGFLWLTPCGSGVFLHTPT
jgi:hypothetical protein